MKSDINPIELAVFLFFFLLVTVIGLFAGTRRRTETSAHLDEWGLGGRQFGTWITWFLVGGDFPMAYTIIAVPALVFGVGAYGFFALPETTIVYPFVFAVMPTLWRAAVERKAVTVADVVRAELGSRALELAIAATEVVATMPYIALQMIGMGGGYKGAGHRREVPLIAAFTILALYDLFAGPLVPALIAFAKGRHDLYRRYCCDRADFHQTWRLWDDIQCRGEGSG